MLDTGKPMTRRLPKPPDPVVKLSRKCRSCGEWTEVEARASRLASEKCPKCGTVYGAVGLGFDRIR